MDLTPYVDTLHRDLVVAAETGGDDARALAERLVAPLESATRLALLDALSAAAGEITRELAPGSVELRLRGREPEFVVTPPPTDEPFGEPAAGPADARAELPPVADADDGGTSRISLRIPTHLKPRIDEAAARAGLSANAWLVRVVAAAVQSDDTVRTADRRRGAPLGRRYQGWVR